MAGSCAQSMSDCRVYSACSRAWNSSGLCFRAFCLFPSSYGGSGSSFTEGLQHKPVMRGLAKSLEGLHGTLRAAQRRKHQENARQHMLTMQGSGMHLYRQGLGQLLKNALRY